MRRLAFVLKLPPGELSKLAELQRKEELKRRVIGPPPPLFPKRRREMLSKCDPSARSEVQKIFEKEPFGELERLVTQTLLKAVHKNAKGMASIRFWAIDLETFSVAVKSGRRRSFSSLWKRHLLPSSRVFSSSSAIHF
jgi:hypothetical protein